MPLFAILLLTATVHGADLKELSVVVVSDSPKGRGEAYADFLRPLVAKAAVVQYSRTQPPEPGALAGDVVLLDWDQTSVAGSNDWPSEMAKTGNPLGSRESWHTPTILLGSAGLLVAETWKVGGDRGCTCLLPFAYDLRDHPVTRGPMPIDRQHLQTTPTPQAFTDELRTPTIQVLPLVDADPKDSRLDCGWCTYFGRLSSMPDVEWISGGINEKEPGAMAIWRQGNLLHFGFQQTPAELNQAGRNLLANCVAYIARFHQDVPIARQETGTGDRAYLGPREQVGRWFQHFKKDGEFAPFMLEMLDADERGRVKPLSHDDAAFEVWCRDRLPYLHSDDAYRWLSVDEDLLAAKTTYESPAFLDLVEQRLAGASDAITARLVRQYLPEAPQAGPPAGQLAWLRTNRKYLFATDAGGYRWYVDPLARARGVASSELRGPARADVLVPGCTPGTKCTP